MEREGGTPPPGGASWVGVVGGDESSLVWAWAAAAAATIDLAPTIESMEKPSLEEPLVLGVTEVTLELWWGSTDDDMVSVTRVIPELAVLDELKLDIIQVCDP